MILFCDVRCFTNRFLHAIFCFGDSCLAKMTRAQGLQQFIFTKKIQRLVETDLFCFMIQAADPNEHTRKNRETCTVFFKHIIEQNE